METADTKIGDSLSNAASLASDQRIHKKFRRATRECRRQIGRYPKGRQFLWIVFRSFDISRRFNQASTLTDVLALRWKGDDWKQMFDFMEEWDDLVGDALGDDPLNDKLIESIDEHLVNQLLSHSTNF